LRPIGRWDPVKPNWWMLPAVVLIAWRAWAGGELWLYGSALVGGLIVGVWLNRRPEGAKLQP
jgi:hypothetical protein